MDTHKQDSDGNSDLANASTVEHAPRAAPSVLRAVVTVSLVFVIAVLGIPTSWHGYHGDVITITFIKVGNDLGSAERVPVARSKVQPFAPAPRPGDDWMQAHTMLVGNAAGMSPELDLLILGDSISEHAAGSIMGHPCCDSVSAAFQSAFNSANVTADILAISGDQSPHLLWRLQNGEWPRTPPKVALLLIGTNDLGQYAQEGSGAMLAAAARTVETVKVIVDWILNQTGGQTDIVIQGLLPRGLHTPDGISYILPSIYSAPIAYVNYHLWRYANASSAYPNSARARATSQPHLENEYFFGSPATWGTSAQSFPEEDNLSRTSPLPPPNVVAHTQERAMSGDAGQASVKGRVFFVDVSSSFLSPAGNMILPSLLPDALHPSAAGEAAMDGIRAAYICQLVHPAPSLNHE